MPCIESIMKDTNQIAQVIYISKNKKAKTNGSWTWLTMKEIP